MLWHSKFESAQIEREKPVILEEISYRHDTPQIAVTDLVTEMVFSGHPLGLSGAGEKEAVQKFQKEDFLKFHQSFYLCQNTLVIVAGKFENAEVADLVSSHFNGVPRGAVIEPVPFRHSGPEILRSGSKDLSRIYFCWILESSPLAPPQNDVLKSSHNDLLR